MVVHSTCAVVSDPQTITNNAGTLEWNPAKLNNVYHVYKQYTCNTFSSKIKNRAQEDVKYDILSYKIVKYWYFLWNSGYWMISRGQMCINLTYLQTASGQVIHIWWPAKYVWKYGQYRIVLQG